MIALRLGVLAVSTVLVAVVLGVAGSDLQSSARRVLITAVVGVLAPLFWPGSAATPARTAVRIVAWSFGAALIAAIVSVGVFPGFAILAIATSCSVLFAILLVVHAMAAGFESIHGAAGRSGGREMSGPVAALALAIWGASPLVLGPAAERLAAAHPWTLDAVVGVSPLTHLAVASGNDLLRNPWFYQHSNLAGLPFAYPGLAELTVAYASGALVLVLVLLASLRSRRPIDAAGPTYPPTEQTR